MHLSWKCTPAPLLRRLAGLSMAALAIAGAAGTAQAGTSVLFIGNSFTYGAGAAVRYYRADTVLLRAVTPERCARRR